MVWFLKIFSVWAQYFFAGLASGGSVFYILTGTAGFLPGFCVQRKVQKRLFDADAGPESRCMTSKGLDAVVPF